MVTAETLVGNDGREQAGKSRRKELMTPRAFICLVGVVLLSFGWSVSQPEAVWAQNPNQARINTLNQEIEILRKKVDYWKPKFDPKYPGWILVPLAKGYLPVARDYTSAADVERDGHKHWVRGESGLYYIDKDLFAYRQQFQTMHQQRPQSWRDTQWRKLVENSDRLKSQLWERIKSAEAGIRNRTSQ